LDATLTNGQKRPITPDEVIGSHQRQGQFAALSVFSMLLTAPAVVESGPVLDLGAEDTLPPALVPQFVEPRVAEPVPQFAEPVPALVSSVPLLTEPIPM